MSSTNRANASERHISDYYVTPVEDVDKFLTKLSSVYPNVLSSCKDILDCSAGGDESNAMTYPLVLKKFGKSTDTIDIREDSLADTIGDYLEYDCKGKYDLVISNPPFNLALEFIQKALDDVKDNGYVIMLLRLNFLEGMKRKEELWNKIMPKYIFVHSKRMSFTESGKTDSVAYAHYVFQKGYRLDHSSIMIL